MPSNTMHTLALLLALTCSAPLSAAEQEAMQTTVSNPHPNQAANSIRFIPMPYLYAVQYDQYGQTNIADHEKSRQALTNYTWRTMVSTIPAYQQQAARIQIMDSATNTGSKLHTDGAILIPLITVTSQPAPVSNTAVERRPIWLHYINEHLRPAWQAPALTPASLAKTLVDKKNKARLAEKMADRAFYFGYDENNDALK